jgi:glutamate synthase (NADPH/NADH) large chain
MTGGTVLVLGPTGRNFAAGMSGGTAYVLDLDPMLVNRDLVDLRPADPAAVEALVRKHFDETGSAVAEKLLENWEAARFTAVVPRDYQRVIEVMQAAEAAGHDVDKAVMAELMAPAPRASQEAAHA